MDLVKDLEICFDNMPLFTHQAPDNNVTFLFSTIVGLDLVHDNIIVELSVSGGR